MGKDFAGLKTLLETPAFDTVVRGKSLQPIMAILNSDEAGQTQFLSVPSDDVLDAIGDGVRTLTAEKLATLQLFTSRNEVNFQKQSVRREIRDIFSDNTTVQDRLAAIASRTRTFAEGLGFASITKEDLWKVLPLIFKSYMAEYQRRG